MKLPTISYAILTHNEDATLEKLLCVVQQYKQHDDEIVIVDDYSTNKKTNKILSSYVNVHRRHMDGDYASQKNFLNSKCNKDYIFQFDADEFPTNRLISSVKHIINKHSDIELFGIPRANTIVGLTPKHIKTWKWKPDIYNRLNYPDYQGRLYKNQDTLQWYRPLHEYIIGHKTLYKIKPNTGFDIIHHKPLEKQLESNSRYYTNYNKDGSIKKT